MPFVLRARRAPTTRRARQTRERRTWSRAVKPCARLFGSICATADAAGKKGADDAASASNAGTQDVVPRSEALRTAFWQHLRDGGGVIKPAYSAVIAM